MDDKGNAFVADFGLATAQSDQSLRGNPISGTPSFMAPEQYRGERASQRTDIWSWGVIFYWLLSGRKPFPATNPDELREWILNRPPDHLSNQPGIPPHLSTIVMRCLAKKLEGDDARYGSFAEVLGELNRQRQRKFTAWASCTLLLLVLTLLLAIFALNLQKETPSELPQHANQLARELYELKEDKHDKMALAFEILARTKGESGEGGFRSIRDGEGLRSQVDDYFMVARPQTNGYLYVFQEDSSGNVEWLFPKNESAYSTGTNPVDVASVIRIPEGTECFYLDDQVGYEHVYVKFAPVRLIELEQRLHEYSRRASGTGNKMSPNGFGSRGIGGRRRPMQLKASSPDGAFSITAETYESEGAMVLERYFKHVPADSSQPTNAGEAK